MEFPHTQKKDDDFQVKYAKLKAKINTKNKQEKSKEEDEEESSKVKIKERKNYQESRKKSVDRKSNKKGTSAESRGCALFSIYLMNCTLLLVCGSQQLKFGN